MGTYDLPAPPLQWIITQADAETTPPRAEAADSVAAHEGDNTLISLCPPVAETGVFPPIDAALDARAGSLYTDDDQDAPQIEYSPARPAEPTPTRAPARFGS